MQQQSRKVNIVSAVHVVGYTMQVVSLSHRINGDAVACRVSREIRNGASCRVDETAFARPMHHRHLPQSTRIAA